MARKNQPARKLTGFTLKVMQVIKKIPRGKVATYSQIAGLAGKPGAARGVVWILHSCSEAHGLPWQRVVNAQGRIAFTTRKWQLLQRRLLKEEKVFFLDSEHVDLARHLWNKKPAKIKNRPRLFS